MEETLRTRIGEWWNWDATPVDLVLFGSIARQEASPESDFDYVIVAYGVVDNPDYITDFKRAADAVKRKLNLRDEGATGLFGRLVSASSLVDLIGLEQDTNQSLTQRILLLEESTPLCSSARYDSLITGIVERYLFEYENRAKRGVPRFLLNDVVRYWRTLAVDYQAKRWRDLDLSSASLRLFKLLTSRKLAFAGTIASLYLPAMREVEANCEFLKHQFSMPPLARLAQLHADLTDEETRATLGRILERADRFVARLGDESFRTAFAEEVGDPAAQDEALQETEALEADLELLFTSNGRLASSPNETLGSLTNRYLLF